MICFMVMASVLGFSRRQPPAASRQPRSCRVTVPVDRVAGRSGTIPSITGKASKLAKSLDGEVMERATAAFAIAISRFLRHSRRTLHPPFPSSPLGILSDPPRAPLRGRRRVEKLRPFLRFSLQVRPFSLPPSPVLFFSVSSSFLCDFLQVVAKIRVLFVVCGCGLTNL